MPSGQGRSITVFHLSSGRIEERRYWDWLQRQVDPGTNDVVELGEMFLDRLRSTASSAPPWATPAMPALCWR